MNMKKLIIALSAVLICFSFGLKAEDIEYHFQEGFATSTPTGWTRTCGSTNATVHSTTPALSFAGTYAVKFDATCIDNTFYLQTPEYSNVGTLSFYIAKNANNTLMDLHILKVVNGVETEIKTIDAYTVPSKTADWLQVSIVVNETSATKFKFYSTIRSGNSAWFAIDDIELTKQSGTVDPPSETIEKLSTDFGDGSWGEILTAAPTSGSYPSLEINGFNLVKAAMVTGNATCPTGEKHTNRMYLDKKANGGSVEFPLLKTVGEVELHMLAGTAGNTFNLEEEINGNWSVIGTYEARKTPDSVYVITLDRNVETKLRVANNSGGAMVIYKIATRTYQESVELNITATTPAEGATCYYNLTKNVLLTFNREVEFGTGNIMLNSTSIPVSACSIDGKTVSIPVTLESTTSGKSYTMTIPEGAFLEKGNTSILSNTKTVSFSTYKTVSYPANYSSQIDVAYSTADVNQNRMDIYYPTSAEKSVPVVINIHGGGWNHGEKESQSGFNVYFNMGMAVANIEYRMTPQATAPAAVEDARCAMMYLLKHADELHIDPNKVIFQGGSAGGHLALTAGYLQNNGAFDTGCNDYAGNYKIVAVIDKYGPSDLTQFMYYSSLVAWLGDKKDDADFIKSISPVYLVDANTPPTYIIHGDADPTVPYSQSELLVSYLQTAGVKYQFTTVPGGGHGEFSDQYNTQMNNEITVFLTDVLGSLSTLIDTEKVAPNKIITVSDQTVSIHVDENSETELFNAIGKKILSSSQKNFTINHLPTGTYIVKVTTKAGSFVRKIVK